MRIIIATLILSLTLVALPASVEAACVLKGEYYSDAECAEIRGGRVLGTSVSNTTYSNTTNSSDSARIAQMERQIQQLTRILEQLLVSLGANPQTNTTVSSNSGRSDVEVRTFSATRIDDDRATLRGRLDINNEDEATVYFEYGRSRTNLSSETTHFVLDEREDEDFTAQIRSLRRDTDYYFRAVAEDERGRRAFGSIFSFSTDDDYSSSGDDEPDVSTDDADDIEETSALLVGEVDMNDFNNGKVFVAYGEDEDQVEDIADDYDEYDDIDEDGDDLQVILIDSDLDDDQDYEVRVRGLDRDTDHYFTYCVEYEDEDDDEVIECGKVDEFTTDD